MTKLRKMASPGPFDKKTDEFIKKCQDAGTQTDSRGLFDPKAAEFLKMCELAGVKNMADFGVAVQALQCVQKLQMDALQGAAASASTSTGHSKEQIVGEEQQKGAAESSGVKCVQKLQMDAMQGVASTLTGHSKEQMGEEQQRAAAESSGVVFDESPESPLAWPLPESDDEGEKGQEGKKIILIPLSPMKPDQEDVVMLDAVDAPPLSPAKEIKIEPLTPETKPTLSPIAASQQVSGFSPKEDAEFGPFPSNTLINHWLHPETGDDAKTAMVKVLRALRRNRKEWLIDHIESASETEEERDFRVSIVPSPWTTPPRNEPDVDENGDPIELLF